MNETSGLPAHSKFKKHVVYTCLFGHYEQLNEQPVRLNSEWDFICFTDRDDLSSGTWRIEKLKTQGLDSSRESRRPKLVPHIYLKDYEISIYIDNSVIFKISPEEILVKIGFEDNNFLCLNHPLRDCTYEEAEEIIKGSIDDEIRVREQMDFYESHGLPRHSGLVAGTFIIRRHNAPEVIAHGEDWYAHVLRFSKRDQLSFQFTALRHVLRYKASDISLASNDLFSWPVHNNRLPYGFDPLIYLWLNPDVARAGVDPAKHYCEFGHQENRPIRYYTPLELDRLANKYRSDKGRLYYNRHYYSRVYERYLTSLRMEEFTLLEIGLLRHDIQARNPNGPFNDAPSLKMWQEYFTRAEIHGFDIQDFSSVENGRIKFTQGDQSNIEDLSKVSARCSKPLRVIIDDGLHASPHQQISLGYLFQKLEPGGLYIIEDLHYQPSRFEPVTGLKTIDLLRSIILGQRPENAFIGEYEFQYLKDNIASVNFYDSMDYNARDIGSDAIAVLIKRQFQAL